MAIAAGTPRTNRSGTCPPQSAAELWRPAGSEPVQKESGGGLRRVMVAGLVVGDHCAVAQRGKKMSWLFLENRGCQR
ncbi:MAG: hypothetical protein CMJ75_22435 [Planctomycetaceae bacterium]|nr:hypothetical protein [Planctomycetaceae bacterium]